MTIYAIVNDFLDPSAAETAAQPVWTIISQSAILQGGNPYFVPDFASRFEARTALAVRIGKLGKGIASRFASRYVDSVAPAVVMVAADRLDSLREAGLPWTTAVSYDRGLALGKLRPMDMDAIGRCRCSLRIDSAEASLQTDFMPAATGPALEETIAAISRDNTLKTGDLLLIGIAGSGPEVRPDSRATLSIDGEESLAFNIR